MTPRPEDLETQRAIDGLVKDAVERILRQRAARRRGVGPTTSRTKLDVASHLPPRTMTDNCGLPWRGTSRTIDKAGRRRKNRRTWRRFKAESRRAFVATQKESNED